VEVTALHRLCVEPTRGGRLRVRSTKIAAYFASPVSVLWCAPNDSTSSAKLGRRIRRSERRSRDAVGCGVERLANISIAASDRLAEICAQRLETFLRREDDASQQKDAISSSADVEGFRYW